MGRVKGIVPPLTLAPGEEARGAGLRVASSAEAEAPTVLGALLQGVPAAFAAAAVVDLAPDLATVVRVARQFA